MPWRRVGGAPEREATIGNGRAGQGRRRHTERLEALTETVTTVTATSPAAYGAARPACTLRTVLSYTFVPVAHALAEPRLKLWLTARSEREYEYGIFWLDLDHDPELRADDLLRPTPEWLRELWRRANSTPPPASEPNISPKARRIVSLCLRRSLEVGEVRLSLQTNVAFERLPAALEADCGLSPGSGGDLLRAIMKAALDLPEWRSGAQGEVREAGTGRLLSGPVRMDVALYAPRETATVLGHSGDGEPLVLIDRRSLLT